LAFGLAQEGISLAEVEEDDADADACTLGKTGAGSGALTFENGFFATVMAELPAFLLFAPTSNFARRLDR